MFRRTSLLIGALPLAVLALAACGGSASNALPTTPNGHPAAVGVANTGLGNVLVDRQGRTLYLFEADKGMTSSCNDSCAAVWPPLTATGPLTAGPGVSQSLLATTTRKDGSMEVVYNGHPLYYFVSDKQAGDTTGQGLSSFGADWYVLSAAGTKIDNG